MYTTITKLISPSRVNIIVSKLPLLEKNAFLSVYLSKGFIYASLAYSHYDIGRKYVLSDITSIDLDKDPIGTREFWMEYFHSLEERFDWDILANSSSHYGLSRFKKFDDEGEGVAGIQFNISELITDRGAMVGALRECIPEIDIKIIDKNSFVDNIWEVASKTGYKDLIYIDMNLKRFDIYRLTASHREKSKMESKDFKRYELSSCKINWDNSEALIDSVKDVRLKAFSGFDLESNDGYNLWANYVLRPVLKPGGKMLADTIRAFCSVQLLSIYNRSTTTFKDFGTKGVSSLVIVAGDLVDAFREEYLIVSILDGLQLRGMFDIVIDKGLTTRTLGPKYSEGVNAADFIVSQDQVLKNGIRTFVPEIPGRGIERKVVFDGSLINEKDGIRPVYGLTPTIMRCSLNKIAKKNTFEGRFVKGAYVEGLDEKIEFISEKNDLIDSVFIDCRFKPVIYGPDYRSNIHKLSSWFDE